MADLGAHFRLQQGVPQAVLTVGVFYDSKLRVQVFSEGGVDEDQNGAEDRERDGEVKGGPQCSWHHLMGEDLGIGGEAFQCKSMLFRQVESAQVGGDQENKNNESKVQLFVDFILLVVVVFHLFFGGILLVTRTFSFSLFLNWCKLPVKKRGMIVQGNLNCS